MKFFGARAFFMKRLDLFCKKKITLLFFFTFLLFLLFLLFWIKYYCASAL
jgi:hypothetical protein